jgi:UDP-glucose 4-epimerase
MTQMMKHEPMTVIDDGIQVRAFSYIGDVASLMAEAIGFPHTRSGVLNIGADAPCSVTSLAVAVARAMVSLPNIAHLRARHDSRNGPSSYDKIRRVFDARAVRTFGEVPRRSRPSHETHWLRPD